MLLPMSAEEHLRELMSRLAEASGLSVPPLVVEDDPDGNLFEAKVRYDEGRTERRIVVSSSLLTAPPAEQAWHLAAALGWWASPVPRRRRLLSMPIIALVLAAYFGVGYVTIEDPYDLPLALQIAAGPVATGVLFWSGAALSRWMLRGSEAAGHRILAAAGYDPVVVARQAFGDRTDPPWWRAMQQGEPAPSRRIAAAERRSADPAARLA
jgi:hypothetical protein